MQWQSMAVHEYKMQKFHPARSKAQMAKFLSIKTAWQPLNNGRGNDQYLL
jgi:hypothetical protein